MIRDALPEDAPALEALMVAVDWWRHGAPDPPASKWAAYIADDRWWVGVADGPQGLAGVVTVRPSAHPGAGKIPHLAVTPSAQRAGLGSALLAAAVERIRAGGYDRGRLRVAVAASGTRAFYERNGWRDVGDRIVDADLHEEMAAYEIRLRA